MTQFVNDLLDYAQIEGKHFILNEQEFSMATLLNDLYKMFTRSAEL